MSMLFCTRAFWLPDLFLSDLQGLRCTQHLHQLLSAYGPVHLNSVSHTRLHSRKCQGDILEDVKAKGGGGQNYLGPWNSARVVTAFRLP